MKNLESDIQSAQRNILQCLNNYQQQSEQLISLNFTTQLHSILDAISTFDLDQLKTVQQQVKDQVALKHLNTISNKIKSATKSKNNTDIQSQSIKRQTKINKSEETTKKQNRNDKKEGFFGTVLKRFASKQKKTSQIILPDNQPNCYFDPVKRIWVFEGQQPDVPKQIPKPPSKSQIIKTKQAKPSQQTQINSLTAPPEFKRKGTSTKINKLKKEIKIVEASEEPLVFTKVLATINKEYQTLLENVISGFYYLPVKEIHLNSQSQLTDFLKLAEDLLHSSEQIAQHEHRLVQKLRRSSLTECPQLKLLQKLLQQVSESSDIYKRMSINLQSVYRKLHISQINCQLQNSSEIKKKFENLQREKIQIQQKIKNLVQNHLSQINKLQLEANVFKKQIQNLQNDLRTEQNQKQNLLQRNQKLKTQIESIKPIIQQLNTKDVQNILKIQNFVQKQHYLEKNNHQLNNQNLQLTNNIESLRKKYQILQSTKNQLQNKLHVLQSNISDNSRAKEQLINYKTIIGNQLKFYQEKEHNFLKSMKSLVEHTTIIQQFQDTLKKENNFLSEILQQRVKLSKISDFEENPSNYQKDIQELTTTQNIVVQLSKIINSITLSHLQRLQSFNRNYSNLSKKYQEAKELNKKIRNNSFTQNMSLNRSISRLKILIESYKIVKEETQDKSRQLQIECQKLRKKLEHYKQEDKFNKSYLSKLKSSQSSNQNESVISLQEDNEELTQTIEDLQKEVDRKDQNCKKLQSDLEDVLANYEKTQQKLLTIEKKLKENEKETRMIKDEKQSWLNKINLLEVKLVNQKQKNQEIILRQASKLKTIESNHQKKIKILRQDLQRALSNQQYLKKEVQQLINENNRKVGNLQSEYRQKVAELKSKLNDKENQLGQILLMVEQLNKKCSQKQEQLSSIKQVNQNLKTKCLQIGQSIDNKKYQLEQLKKSEQLSNNKIEEILAQFRSYKDEQFDLRKDYEAKLQFLMSQLHESEERSRYLFQNINQYSILLNNLDLEYQAKQQSQQKYMNQLKQLSVQNKELSQNIEKLQVIIEQKNQQISDLQLLTSSLSISVQLLRSEKAEVLKQNGQTTHRLRQLQISLQQRVNKMSEQNKILSTQALSIQIMNLQTELTKVNNQMSISKVQTDQKITENEQQIKLLKNNLSQKQKELCELSQALENCSKDLLIQQEEKNTLKQQYHQSKANFGLVEQLFSELKQTFVTIQSQNTILKQNNEQKNSLLQSKQIELQRFKEIYFKYTQEREQLQKKIEKLESNIEEQLISSKQIQQKIDADVQSEMQYLLKEIQSKQTQINQLKQQISAKNVDLSQLLKQNEDLKLHIRQLTITKSQLALSKDEEALAHANQIKRRQSQIEKLKSENKSLNEVLQNIQKEHASAISELKNSQIAKLQQDINQRSNAIALLCQQKQPNEKLQMKMIQLPNEKIKENIDPETKTYQLPELLEQNQRLIEQNRVENIKYPSQEMINKDNLLINLKNEIKSLNQQTVQREKEYQDKIKSLQKQIVSLNSLIPINKKLADQYNQLQSENSSLLAEKLQLLQSNDNLVKINEKLIIELSPHNKIVTKIPKPVQKPSAIIQQPKEEQKEGTKTEMKEALVEKQEVKGFLGSLSSFFLTPTQNERLVRK